MATITLDTLKNSAYDSNAEMIRVQRGFVATGLDTSQPFNVIRAAIVAGLPQRGQEHPTELGTFVVGYRIKLETDSIASGSVIYETPKLRTGTPKDKNKNGQSPYIFRDTTSLQQIQTEINPADKGRPIYVNYKNPSDKNAVRTTKIVPVRYLRPVRNFVASGLFPAPPNNKVRNALGSVNKDKFLDLGTGYWLFAGLDVDTRDSGQTYEVTLTFMSMCNEDWSAWAIFKDNQGQHVIIKPEHVASLRELPYDIGVHTNNGISRVGLYPMISFGETFQFQNI